jgi:hypothetical protein
MLAKVRKPVTAVMPPLHTAICLAYELYNRNCVLYCVYLRPYCVFLCQYCVFLCQYCIYLGQYCVFLHQYSVYLHQYSVFLHQYCAARAFCDCPAIISLRPRSQNISKEPHLNPEKDSRRKKARPHVSLEKSSQNYKPLDK